jgi:hypothetical protein
MYHLRVEAAERQMADLGVGEDEDLEVFRQPASDLECVQYSAGNPSVEHITGLVHLYKQNDATPAQSEGTPSTSYANALQVCDANTPDLLHGSSTSPLCTITCSCAVPSYKPAVQQPATNTCKRAVGF